MNFSRPPLRGGGGVCTTVGSQQVMHGNHATNASQTAHAIHERDHKI